MKPFQTKEQQINILKNRGMLITDVQKALGILERENYYSLVNGYKDIFLQKDLTSKNLDPEKYKTGVTFEELHSLFILDRELRITLLEYLLKFESDIKTKISYRFSEKYSENHAYLIFNNYSANPEKIKIVLVLISNLSKTISSEAHKKNAISHYLEKYHGVPLWVLVNFLTMGNMQYFYQSLIDSLQNAVAKDFAIAYSMEHKSRIHLTSEMLESVLKITSFFRNLCAHEERLYNFSLNKPVKNANISSVLGIPNSKLIGGDLFSLVAFLKLVLPKTEHENMLKKFDKLFNEYSSEFHSVDFEKIMLEMGFEQGWEKYFI